MLLLFSLCNLLLSAPPTGHNYRLVFISRSFFLLNKNWNIMYTGLVTVMTQIITIILFPFFCGNSPIKTDYQIFFFTFLAAILELQIYLSVFKYLPFFTFFTEPRFFRINISKYKFFSYLFTIRKRQLSSRYFGIIELFVCI